MVSGKEINSEGILSNYKSNFLNYIEIRSENCGLTIVHVSSSGFAIQRHVVRMRLNTLPMANLRLEYLALFCVMCIKSIYEVFSQIPLDKSFILLHFDVISMRTRTGQYKTRTTDYGLRVNHGLRYKTPKKHYGLGMKYGLGIKDGLGYEQAHTGCKLHPLSVLRAKATSSTCYVTWPM